MAGSERPVNPSSESSQHLKEDETPQSLDSKERKVPRRIGRRFCSLVEKKEPELGPNRVFNGKLFDGYQSQEVNYARYPLLDEDLIGERGGALHRDYGGGTRLTINRLKSNLIQEKLDEAQQFITRKSWEKCCIYRMPRRIRDAQESKKLYEPQTISIGAYHIGSELVLDMDLYKWVAMYQILQRTGQDLSLYFDTVSQVEDQARACYKQVNHLSSNKFVEMMVLDGCFILELLRYYPARDTTGGNPVFANKRIVEDIVLDMVMLENQVPLFIIDRLLKLMNENQHQNDQALDLVLNFFNPIWLTGIRMSANELNELNSSLRQEECLHVLDVFRRSLLHVRPQQGTINKHRFRWMVCDNLVPMCLKRWLHCLCENKASDSISGREQVLHRVTELRKGGVKFRKRNTSCFWTSGSRTGFLKSLPFGYKIVQ